MLNSFRIWLEERSLAEGRINDMIRRQVLRAVGEYVRRLAANPGLAYTNELEKLVPLMSLRDRSTLDKMNALVRKYKPSDDPEKAIDQTLKLIEELTKLMDNQIGRDVIEKMQDEISRQATNQSQSKNSGMPPKIRDLKAQPG